MTSRVMPTVRKIAEACGLSASTVAAALRRSPVVAEATRRKVEAVATRLGYRQDARLAQLMAYMRRGRIARPRCNLGWLNFHEEESHWLRHDYAVPFFAAARAKARALGYHLEQIWLRDPKLRPQRVNRLLAGRGLQGLVAALPRACPALAAVEWSNYFAVALSQNLPELALDRITPHYHDDMMRACRELHRLGYRRPGFFVHNYSDDETSWAWSSAFVRMQQVLFPENPIMVPAELYPQPPIEEWVRRHRPDVIVCCTHGDYDALQRAGIRVPEDVALIHLTLGPDTPGWAGLDPHQALLGEKCIESLVARIQQGKPGQPEHPTALLVRSAWRDGWTAPPVGRRSG